MKAVVYHEFGTPDVLHIEEVEKPVAGDNDVLIKVIATTVNYGDLLARNFRNISPRQFNMPGLFWIIARMDFGINYPKKKILGSEFSGIVETTGKNVIKYQPGDLVFGYPGQRMGAYAEYLCMPEDGVLAKIPETISTEEAAVIPYGLITAYSLLRKQNIQPGQKILINGASGGIGGFAVQVAKYFGATVTGVCSTPRKEYVRSLGADYVVDYRHEDFAKNGETYDLIFDVLGRSTFSRVKNSLTKNGRYVLASFKLKQLGQMFLTSLKGGRKVICSISPQSPQDFNEVLKLLNEGVIKVEIDKVFPIEQIADAHAYIEDGHKKGSIVIAFSESQKPLEREMNKA